jgi:hypothetical protein
MTEQLQDRIRQALQEAKVPVAPSPLDWDSLRRGASRRRRGRQLGGVATVGVLASAVAVFAGLLPADVGRTSVAAGPASPVPELTYASVPWDPGQAVPLEPPWERGSGQVTLRAGSWPLTSYRVGDRTCTSVVRTDLGSAGDTVCARPADTGLGRAAIAGALAMVVLDDPVETARFTVDGRDVEAVVYERLDTPGVRVATALVADPRAADLVVPDDVTFAGADATGAVVVSGPVN